MRITNLLRWLGLAIMGVIIVVVLVKADTSQAPSEPPTPESSNDTTPEGMVIDTSETWHYKDATIGARFSYYDGWLTPDLTFGNNADVLTTQAYINGKWQDVPFLYAAKLTSSYLGTGPLDLGAWMHEAVEDDFCTVILTTNYDRCDKLVNANGVTFYKVEYLTTSPEGTASRTTSYVAAHPSGVPYSAVTISDFHLNSLTDDHDDIARQLEYIVDTFTFTKLKDQSLGYERYTSNELGFKFDVPTWWGDITMEPNFDDDYARQEMFNLFANVDAENDILPLFLSVLINESSGRGAYWGDAAWNLTAENETTFCEGLLENEDPNGSCEYIENDHGVGIIHWQGEYCGFCEAPERINVYIIRHPIAPFRAIVLSDERLLDEADLLGDVDEQLRVLVESFDFVGDVPKNE